MSRQTLVFLSVFLLVSTLSQVNGENSKISTFEAADNALFVATIGFSGPAITSYQQENLHNALFEVEGNLNNAKLKQIIENLELNDAKLNIDMTKESVNNIVRLSSFLANGSGARGTPTFFVNEELVVGYISIDRIKALLK